MQSSSYTPAAVETKVAAASASSERPAAPATGSPPNSCSCESRVRARLSTACRAWSSIACPPAGIAATSDCAASASLMTDFASVSTRSITCLGWAIVAAAPNASSRFFGLSPDRRTPAPSDLPGVKPSIRAHPFRRRGILTVLRPAPELSQPDEEQEHAEDQFEDEAARWPVRRRNWRAVLQSR